MDGSTLGGRRAIAVAAVDGRVRGRGRDPCRRGAVPVVPVVAEIAVVPEGQCAALPAGTGQQRRRAGAERQRGDGQRGPRHRLTVDAQPVRAATVLVAVTAGRGVRASPAVVEAQRAPLHGSVPTS